jgi:glycerol-3-phosphate dehydrogenase
MILDYDLCIIGGGINGAGIARDAAGRGLKVLLVEKGDLACATSSASTKLIHGGLRYLEYYEFKLVRDSLQERETLLNIAPHIIHPMTFVLPHNKGQRPKWMIRSGLFLYDHLAKRKRLNKSHTVDLKTYGPFLRGQYKTGFSYSDCRADDSRLVVLNAMDAAHHGATVLTRTECVRMEAEGQRWRIALKDLTKHTESHITAAAVVNAAGPWVRTVIEQSDLDAPDVPNLRLVKGSHIIVPKLFDGGHAYILQQPDKRIVFAIPYEGRYTLIGTTDVNFEGDPATVKISDEEIEYLCAAVNRVSNRRIAPGDVVWTYSGVRSLFDDGKQNASSVTRDYHLHVHENTGDAKLISVFGGKLTTYRVLAEKTVNMLLKETGRVAEEWTANAVLPGGDIPHADFDLFVIKKTTQYPWLPPALLQRYARTYGTRMDHFLEGAKSHVGLGRAFGDDIYEAEILYLVRHEWARDIEDILWRRTKTGLYVGEETIETLEKALPKILERVKQP